MELFYALVAAIGSESRRCLWGRGGHIHAVCMQRWLATAKPLARAVGHGLATCKGWATVPKAPLQGAIVRRGSSPQGAATRKGNSHPRARPTAASPAASKGGGANRNGGRPLAGWLLIAKGSRRLHKGSSGDDA
ncbi:hypothetical protein GW17_00055378 [Ensete ventricosum]|nr:hypothetical protein GW17_00055378 [Ensete ventricosum]RZR79785.1 hypothetical protein BHM03_00005614 [Ensete ventricosum]